MLFENISRLCRKKNISIARLERELGFGNATIRGWAVSSPRADMLQKVAVYFGTTMDALMTSRGDE